MPAEHAPCVVRGTRYGSSLMVSGHLSDQYAGKRIAVACHELICSGGLLRFERFGRVVSSWGAEVCFVVFAPTPRFFFRTQFEVLGIADAGRRLWDMTMVPGAGFPSATVKRMRILQNPAFGTRVQHILNSPALAHKFMALNRIIRPHVVVFNNRHWSHCDTSSFEAVQCAVVEGAVDVHRLGERSNRNTTERRDTFVIGGLANKNPGPLIEAVRGLPSRYVLRLFGDPREACSLGGDLLRCGRLECAGLLDDDALPAYYGGLDCVVQTERFAGWSNLAAEALACGLPLICTRHGTCAFAEHGRTALVVEPESGAIRSALERVFTDSSFACTVAARGRARIESFTWERYARELLAVCDVSGPGAGGVSDEHSAH